MITIVLAENRPVIRIGLRELLNREPNFKVVGEASDGLETINAVNTFNPDIVILDISLDKMRGLETARTLNKESKPGIVIITWVRSEYYVVEAFRAGAKAYVLLEENPEELIQAIRETAAGYKYISSYYMHHPLIEDLLTGYSVDAYAKLTAREREILQLSTQGVNCTDIANQLGISRRTVELHRANMMRKLGFSRSASLYIYTYKHGVPTEMPQIAASTSSDERIDERS